MQIRCCESCGARLTELGGLANARSGLCAKCAAARGQKPGAPTPAPGNPVSRKSSPGGLRAIQTSSTGPARRTPTGGSPVPQSADPPRRRSSGQLRALESDKPPSQTAKRTPGSAADSSADSSAPSSSAMLPNAPAGCMAFYYCEKCGKRVTAADLVAGQGRDKQLAGIHCAGCSDGSLTVSFDAVSQAEVFKEAEARRRGTRRSTSTRLSVSTDVPGSEHGRSWQRMPPWQRRT